MIIKKKPDQLRVGDKIVVKDGLLLRIDSLTHGMAGILCPLIKGTYIGPAAEFIQTKEFQFDTGASPKGQDHIFDIEV